MFGSRLRLVSAAGILAGFVLAGAVGEAHKPISSKYTYTEDVFPILRDHCARCHVTGGIAPMSLMTYAEAVPWAESIRAELIAGHMPPWTAEGSTPLKGSAHALSARELDVLLIWASGGTPRGAARRLPVVPLKRGWSLGAPDLELKMPEAVTLDAKVMEETREFLLASGTAADRWISAVDLLPGEPAVVHDATISLAQTPDDDATVLAAWVPGQDPVRQTEGGFLLPAGAHLRLTIHYRKTWKLEGTAITDQSVVGVYFAAQSPAPIHGILISTAADAAPGPRPLVFSRRIDQSVDAIAVRPDIDRPDVALRVDAVLPNRARIGLIQLTTRPHWNRRYWFERPVHLPRGTRIDVTATNAPAAHAAPEGASQALRLWIDTVPSPLRRAR